MTGQRALAVAADAMSTHPSETRWIVGDVSPGHGRSRLPGSVGQRTAGWTQGGSSLEPWPRVVDASDL